MNGLRFLFSLLVLTLLPPIFAVADESRDKDGQYFCLVEHVAGIINTTNEAGSPKYSGKINLPEQELKFFITVGPKIYDASDMKACENEINYWLMEFLKKGLPYEDRSIPSRSSIHNRCFASEEITWKSLDGMLTLKFRGFGSFEYYSYQPSTWFEFYKDAGHTFQMGMGHSHGGPVVEDGHCTKIEPPK